MHFLCILSELLHFCSSFYDNKVVFCDFNLEISHPVMLSFLKNENFINLIKEILVLRVRVLVLTSY